MTNQTYEAIAWLAAQMTNVADLRTKLYAVAGQLQSGIDRGQYSAEVSDQLKPTIKWLQDQAYSLTEFVRNLDNVPKIDDSVKATAHNPNAN